MESNQIESNKKQIKSQNRMEMESNHIESNKNRIESNII